MAGGDPADLEQAAPIFADLAGNTTHMGQVGAGQITKMVNQTIVGAGFVVMAEALRLAEASGIDAARLPAALAGGFADSALLQRVYPQMQARAFDPPLGYARQLLKDLKAVAEYARTLDLSLPMAELACRRYAEYVAGGNELADSASIIRLYEAANEIRTQNKG
jgi:3-hydroxyisobutyrate dehydrogenase